VGLTLLSKVALQAHLDLKHQERATDQDAPQQLEPLRPLDAFNAIEGCRRILTHELSTHGEKFVIG